MSGLAYSIPISVPYLSARRNSHLDQLLYKGTKQRDRSSLKSSTSNRLRLAESQSETEQMLKQYFLFIATILITIGFNSEFVGVTAPLAPAPT